MYLQLGRLRQRMEIGMQPQKIRIHLIYERRAPSRLRYSVEKTAIREVVAGSLVGVGMVIGIAATFWRLYRQLGKAGAEVDWA